jgi:UDP-galactopyranose mutase
MPVDGYTAMFQRMLQHRNILVSTSTDFTSLRGLYPDARVIFTGPIDEYFGSGALPYRSIRF